MKKYIQYIGIAISIVLIAIAAVICVGHNSNTTDVQATAGDITAGDITAGDVVESTELTIDGATQPDVADDLLCYDYVNGCVYTCYYIEDGNVQLRINPEGNLVFAQTLNYDETAVENEIAGEEQPDTENDIVCYDYARGCAYACFVRDDGNIQLRVGEFGGLVVVASVDSYAVSLYNLYSERAE